MKTTSLYILLFICWKTICCHSCELSNITIAVEKEECNFCISVTAAWCSGRCKTMDPVDKNFLRRQIQKICTYQNLEYRTVMVPGCDGYEESIYHYPVATGCHCNLCDTDTTDCTIRGIEPDYCSFGQDQFKKV